MSSLQTHWYGQGAIDAGIKLAIDAQTLQTMLAAAGKHGMPPHEVNQMLMSRMQSDARALPEHLVPKSIPGLDTHPVEGMNPAHEALTPPPGAPPVRPVHTAPDYPVGATGGHLPQPAPMGATGGRMPFVIPPRR